MTRTRVAPVPLARRRRTTAGIVAPDDVAACGSASPAGAPRPRRPDRAPPHRRRGGGTTAAGQRTRRRRARSVPAAVAARRPPARTPPDDSLDPDDLHRQAPAAADRPAHLAGAGVPARDAAHLAVHRARARPRPRPHHHRRPLRRGRPRPGLGPHLCPVPGPAPRRRRPPRMGPARPPPHLPGADPRYRRQVVELTAHTADLDTLDVDRQLVGHFAELARRTKDRPRRPAGPATRGAPRPDHRRRRATVPRRRTHPLHPRPRPDLPVPDVHRPRRGLPPRPHPRLAARRPHPGRQPRRPLRRGPPPQTRPPKRLDRRTTHGGHLRVDLTHRHHPHRRPRALPTPAADPARQLRPRRHRHLRTRDATTVAARGPTSTATSPTPPAPPSTRSTAADGRRRPAAQPLRRRPAVLDERTHADPRTTSRGARTRCSTRCPSRRPPSTSTSVRPSSYLSVCTVVRGGSSRAAMVMSS